MERAHGRDRFEERGPEIGARTLDRGSSKTAVIDWLRKAAGVPGFIGFAVGRTTFWDPIVAYRDGKTTREQAAQQIADNLAEWVDVFRDAEGRR